MRVCSAEPAQSTAPLGTSSAIRIAPLGKTEPASEVTSYCFFLISIGPVVGIRPVCALTASVPAICRVCDAPDAADAPGAADAPDAADAPGAAPPSSSTSASVP